MHYYKVSVIGSVLEPLTYSFQKKISLFYKVKVTLNNKEKYGVVVEEVEVPEFKTLPILEVTTEFFSKKQFQLASFIAGYYFCSLGEAFGLMLPFSSSEQFIDQFQEIDSKITLSDKQKRVIDFLQQHKVALLFGDTGSGKTEIHPGSDRSDPLP